MKENIIGIDLGATNIRAGLVNNGVLSLLESKKINSLGTVDDVLRDFYTLIESKLTHNIQAIGIGVPSVVDVENGIVYDVQYIPSWKEVHLKSILEERFKIPVYINNDANCFALGELYFGKGIGHKNMLGLSIGTGLGAGLILNNSLITGPNCGVGEFGMVEYLDHCYEYYASGQFFKNVYNVDGEWVFEQAKKGDKQILEYYQIFGFHVGKVIKLILYTLDIPLIILGGSVSKAYSFFEQTMWQEIRNFAYPKSLINFKIEVSNLNNASVLGAASLYFDAQKK